MSATLATSEAAILDRVLRPDAHDLPAPAAEAILALGFNESDRARMTLLLEAAKSDALSKEETAELENYRHIGRLLELMKSRARRSLKTSGK